MKNTLQIIGGICVFIFVILLGALAIYFPYKAIKGNDNKSKQENKYENYKRLKNDNIKYKYISSYDEYLDFMEDNEISKSDYYKSFSKDDFKSKKYLFVIIPYDECSENIKKDKLVKDDNTYKVYLDMKYTCGVCAPSKYVLSYEVKKTNLKTKVYTKTVSREECDPNVAYKPIIYIYPEEDMDLAIKLGKPNNLLHTYPKYHDIWNVHVTKDGNIYDFKTNRNYYSLYWEAIDNYELDMSQGFVVKGSEVVEFLEEKLAILGLNEYEINEFIIYWIDKLENNNYNFISFRSMTDINKLMPLEFSIKPDTLIRVMMDFKPLDDYISVNEQQLVKAERKGYTVVEWGGVKH